MSHANKQFAARMKRFERNANLKATEIQQLCKRNREEQQPSHSTKITAIAQYFLGSASLNSQTFPFATTVTRDFSQQINPSQSNHQNDIVEAAQQNREHSQTLTHNPVEIPDLRTISDNCAGATYDSDCPCCQQRISSPDPSSDENFSSSSSESSFTFKEELTSWALSNNINHTQLNSLLGLLKKHSCFEDLPRDARTLLRTPRKVSVEKMHPGEFCFFGLDDSLKRYAEEIDPTGAMRSCNLLIGVDGMQIFERSTNKQFWPILGMLQTIEGDASSSVFVIGTYYGLHKPSSADKFLRKLVDELNVFIREGFSFLSRTVTIARVIFVCDAPARSFLLGVKTHSGYSCCTKCLVVGQYATKPHENVTVVRESDGRETRPRGRIVFLETDAALRTDYSFRARHDTGYHVSYSSIEELAKLDLVRDFPLDPMHLVDEGAGKKIIMLHLEDKDFRLSPRVVRRINAHMSAISAYTPREFARKARPFTGKMKATEWKQAILYSCPVVFQETMSSERYIHLLSFCIAIRILSSRRFCTIYNDYAKTLLRAFVVNSAKLYTKAFVCFNIHCLIHLADDVKHLGPCPTYSAYPFESKLGQMKRQLRKAERPLQQIVKRIAEQQQKPIKKKSKIAEKRLSQTHAKGPLPLNIDRVDQQYKMLSWNGFIFTVNERDGYLLLKDKRVVLIRNVIVINAEIFLVVQQFGEQSNLFPDEFNSMLLDIFKCSHLSNVLQLVALDQVFLKMYGIPMFKSDSMALFPIENVDFL